MCAVEEVEVEVEVVVETAEVVAAAEAASYRPVTPEGIIRLRAKRPVDLLRASCAASAAVGAPGRADASATGVGVWKISIPRGAAASRLTCPRSLGSR